MDTLVDMHVDRHVDIDLEHSTQIVIVITSKLHYFIKIVYFFNYSMILLHPRAIHFDNRRGLLVIPSKSFRNRKMFDQYPLTMSYYIRTFPLILISLNFPTGKIKVEGMSAGKGHRETEI